jgi:hypothetical protein
MWTVEWHGLLPSLWAKLFQGFGTNRGVLTGAVLEGCLLKACPQLTAWQAAGCVVCLLACCECADALQHFNRRRKRLSLKAAHAAGVRIISLPPED